MDKELVKKAMNRFKVLEELDVVDRLDETLEIRWKRMNSLHLLGKELGFDSCNEIENQSIRDRWLKLIKDNENQGS